MPAEDSAEIVVSYGDLSSHETWNQLLDGVDTVFHLAADEYKYGDEERVRDDLIENVIPMLTLLESCRITGFRPDILFTSSVHLFGHVSSTLVTEKHPSKPLTAWGVHKMFQEQYLQYYGRRYGIPSSTLRLPNIFGLSERREVSDRVVINRVISTALEGGQLTTFANRDCFRDYLYIDDAVDAFLVAAIKSVSTSAPFYVLGSGLQLRIREVWDMIASVVEETTGHAMSVSTNDEAVLDPLEFRDYVGDAKLFHERTGWVAQTSVQKGLRQTVNKIVAE